MKCKLRNASLAWLPYIISAFLDRQVDCLSVSAEYYRGLSKRAIDDHFTPHDPPFRWAALGDSYTAGPGAGDLDSSNSGKCLRSVGSYAPQLQQDWPYNGAHTYNFSACTGAKTPQVIDDQIPTISNDPAPDLVVLTIGGNDVGFSKIAKSCLVGLIGSGNCDDKINAAKAEWQSDDFKSRLDKVFDGIYEKMPPDFHYQVIQLGYSAFFNTDDDSTWCNDQSFGKRPFTLNPPPLKLELRRKLNELVSDFNTQLFIHALSYAWKKLIDNDAREHGGWIRQRLWFGNLDGSDKSFNGHRFCEKGVEDPNFQDPSTWIFGVWGKQKDSEQVVTASYFDKYDPNTCSKDPNYEGDDAFAWECDMAQYYASPGADKNAETITGLDFTRSFHPKTAGFTNTKDYLTEKITTVRKQPEPNQCIKNPVNIDLNNLDTPANNQLMPVSLCDTGHGYATALSSSSPSASTPGPTVAPVDSPKKDSCEPLPSGHYQDSHENSMSREADFFCNKYVSGTAEPGDKPVHISQDTHMGVIASGRGPGIPVSQDYTGTDVQDDVYTFKVDSVDGCAPKGGTYNLQNPVDGHGCGEMMKNAWHECSNGGRGGAYAAGCLKYSLKAKY